MSPVIVGQLIFWPDDDHYSVDSLPARLDFGKGTYLDTQAAVSTEDVLAQQRLPPLFHIPVALGGIVDVIPGSVRL